MGTEMIVRFFTCILSGDVAVRCDRGVESLLPSLYAESEGGGRQLHVKMALSPERIISDRGLLRDAPVSLPVAHLKRIDAVL